MKSLWRVLAAAGLMLAAFAGAAPAAEPLPEWRYTLRPGDTLIGLSQRYLAQPSDWPRVQRHNRIADPARLVPGSVLRIPLAWLRQTPAPATVVSVTGQAAVTPPGEPARAVRAGESLFAGAQLTTATNSSVTLRFADGSLLVLQPDATLVLDSVSVYAGGGMADTRLRLQQGRVEVGANPQRAPGNRLKIITPSAVAAVRGTRFRVGADSAVTQQETLQGEVAFDAAGRGVTVTAGRGSVAETGHPPSAPVALLPAPQLAHLPARVEALPLSFEWPAQPGAVGWLAQVAPDTRFEDIWLERSTATAGVRFADLPDGDYVLRVRAADAQGLQGFDALHSFTLDARPFAPLVVAPATRVREALPTFSWSSVVGAGAYRVQLSRTDDFTAPLVDTTLAGTAWQPAAPLEPGNYVWRVASVVGSDTGPFSAPRRLLFDPLPGAPDVATTQTAFADGTLSLRLPPPPAGLRYEVIVSRDAAQATVLWRGESADGSVQVSSLAREPVYLGARLVEADGTTGPFAVRRIEPPPRPFWEPLLLLLPLLFVL